MPDWMENLFLQFRTLPPARQATFVATAVGSLAFFLWLSSGATSSEYRVLFRGLEDAQMAQVADGLSAERIDYQLGEGGTSILVPAPMVHEARMRIASRGLPSGRSPGFEIFDQGSFGVTDFVQKINYHRALQGELARTIEQVEGVEKARVQLALPKRKMMLRKEERRATASVVTRLRPGRELEPGQVRGIVHLVASSVEGLEVSHVTLVDNRGRLLAPQPDMGLAGAGSGKALGAERRIEGQLEQQIEEILGRTIGLGRVVAKVSASLDWTQTEKTEEFFDPDGQIARSTQTDRETANENLGEGGVAGIAANSPDAATEEATAPSQGNSTNRTSETVNYEISKTVSRHVLPTGRIERLSIAVLVDGKPVAAPAAGAEESEDPLAEGAAFAPWEAEKLREFEELAKRAVGFDPDRGDEISVINAPFIEIEPGGEGGSFLTPDIMVLLTSAFQAVAFLIGLLLFSKLFVRPLADAVGNGSESAAIETLRDEVMEKLARVEIASGAEGSDGLLEAELSAEDMEIPGLVSDSDEITLQQQVDRLAQLRTEDSVRTIRGWMATGGA